MGVGSGGEFTGDAISRQPSSPSREQYNTRLDRTILRPDRLDHDLARVRRYLLSYKFLTDQISEDQYRTLMAGVG